MKIFTFLITLLIANISFAQTPLLEFDVDKMGGTNCANHMNNGVYAFDTFYWIVGTSASAPLEENMNSISDTAGLTYTADNFELSFFKHVNVVDPNGDPTTSGQRGDFRHYTGGTIEIRQNGNLKLKLIDCRTSGEVSYPPALDGPGQSIEGSAWGTIDEANSDANWVAEFNVNATGQVYLEYSSYSEVVGNSCGLVSQYDFIVSLYPSDFTETRTIMKLNSLSAPVVNMPGIDLYFDFDSYTEGGQSSDKDELYGNYITTDPGGTAPGVINQVSSVSYWEIGTTLSSFSTDVKFYLADYPGISDINNIRMLRRPVSGADWEIYSSQSISGDTIICTGVTEFSQWTPGSVGADPLPVELTSFSATVDNNNVLLNWKTSNEIDNYGFEIQRKSNLRGQQSIPGNSDLEGYTKIGFVNGAGNSNSTKEYNFTDKNLSDGKYQYRLKQIDTDGDFEYSKIVEAEVIKPIEFSLNQNYPNPFNPETSIEFSLEESGHTSLNIFNLLGERVAVLFNENAESGKTYKVKFDASDLPGGMYLYSLEQGDKKIVKKMILLK